MPELWQVPVMKPLFTDALAQELVDAAKTADRKAKAFDTRIRFSDSGRCARQLAYEDLGVTPEVWDAASLHVAFIGTTYHELLQAAIQRRFPGCKIEVKGIVPEANNSGHCDATAIEEIIQVIVRNWKGGDVLFELKTKGTYQFDKSVGIMRKSFKRSDPKGPALEVIMQAGMNARANNCETVVVGYVCFENFSVGLAEKVGLRQMDRFLAEWHIPRSVWEPVTEREIERLQEVMQSVDLGYLPEREVYDENPWYQDHIAELKIIAPEASKPAWNCDYCSFRARCEEDGPGTVEIPVAIRKSAA